MKCYHRPSIAHGATNKRRHTSTCFTRFATASYENKDEGIELGEVLYGAEKITKGGVVPGFHMARSTFDIKINELEQWGLIKVTRGKKRKDGQGNLPNSIKLNFKPYSSK